MEQEPYNKFAMKVPSLAYEHVVETADLELLSDTLHDYQVGLIPREDAIRNILICLGLVDEKPPSPKIKEYDEVKEYEERAHDLIQEEIRKAMEGDKN